MSLLEIGHLWHAGRARAAATRFEKGIDLDFERSIVILNLIGLPQSMVDAEQHVMTIQAKYEMVKNLFKLE
ncbi:unnamed protein product [Prunus armeniaca]